MYVGSPGTHTHTIGLPDSPSASDPDLRPRFSSYRPSAETHLGSRTMDVRTSTGHLLSSPGTSRGRDSAWKGQGSLGRASPGSRRPNPLTTLHAFIKSRQGLLSVSVGGIPRSVQQKRGPQGQRSRHFTLNELSATTLLTEFYAFHQILPELSLNIHVPF